MIDRIKKIEEKMHERGYRKGMECRGKNDVLLSITFLYAPSEETKETRFPIPTYSVTVWVEDEEFQFMYSVGTSINKLVSPKCGSFFNDEHFDRLAMKFEREASVLYKYCG